MGTFIVVLILAAVFLAFERSSCSSRKLVLISALSAIAALGRIPFAAIPSVQPTTFITVVSGYALGPWAGLMIGAVAAFVSNFFLGQGPWTPWQMMAWGLAGMTAGFAGKMLPLPNKAFLIVFCGLWGYLFGLIMNLWTWSSYIHPSDLKAYLLICAASFWTDTLHAVGNMALAWVLGKELIGIISRFNDKTTFRHLDT